MAIFTVHGPAGLADPVTRAERAVFVRDGFSFSAFLFGPLYLLRHRAWASAIVWVLAVGLGAWLCAVLHLPGAVRAALLGLAMLLTGLEASSARRLSLHRRGLGVVGLARGRRLEDAERSYFAATAAEPPRTPAPASAPRRPVVPPPSGVIGLFPEPGGPA